MQTISFSPGEIPVAMQADVAVCGGGPAGFSAAAAAARHGAKTVLLEGSGMLGGIWTAGLVGDISDIHLKTGYTRALIDRMLACGAAVQRRNTPFCESEGAKHFLERECLEAGVHIRLYTKAIGADCACTELTHVVTHSKSGLEAWGAKQFIDATGDGDLGALAGCRYDMGQDGHVQPLSLTALVAGLDVCEVAELDNSVIHTDGSPKKRFLEVLRQAGCAPSYSDPSLYHLLDDVFVLSVNHEYGVSADDAQALSDATIHARQELRGVVEKLRASGGRWKNVRLLSTSAQIGVREGRRLQGLCRITLDDLLAGRAQPDSVCKATFPIDVHSTKPGESTSYYKRPDHMKTKPYDIPLRALIAADAANLFMAGRCISGDFHAHASYRVTGNAVATGYAAGYAAAYCVQCGIGPHTMDFPAVAALIRG